MRRQLQYMYILKETIIIITKLKIAGKKGANTDRD
jgi:hypothetical protein